MSMDRSGAGMVGSSGKGRGGFRQEIKKGTAKIRALRGSIVT